MHLTPKFGSVDHISAESFAPGRQDISSRAIAEKYREHLRGVGVKAERFKTGKGMNADFYITLPDDDVSQVKRAVALRETAEEFAVEETTQEGDTVIPPKIQALIDSIYAKLRAKANHLDFNVSATND